MWAGKEKYKFVEYGSYCQGKDSLFLVDALPLVDALSLIGI
jgi:hypothetical protein